MDVNLTGPIAANLVEALKQRWYNPLIVNLLPIVVVLIGSYATFFYANQRDDKRRRYELKKQVYFESLEAIYDLSKNPRPMQIYAKQLRPVLQDLGDMPGAKKNCERALEIFRKFLGENHLSIVTVRNNLALLNDSMK